MLIGELAERTGTSERLLRYYERAGLLQPARQPNGYRTYDDNAQETVLRIRALLAGGLPTRVIRELLPCTDGEATVRPCPGVLDALRDQLHLLDQRAAEIAEARSILSRTIASAEAAEAAGVTGAAEAVPS
ncbi:MerR family transcriptional regulator [Streptomyces palmae]|uniref:MerR family transcriptional regulator n=1 Tax=Streptomyces palmae TaxID=1701085 RepID=A0A4Z0GP99_9ACTN|nr:MerR family transcriptional regulator [Streptomyces palmae]TGA98059.1 MerR family transcriptional regulator [Streptomyces palmae]